MPSNPNSRAFAALDRAGFVSGIRHQPDHQVITATAEDATQTHNAAASATLTTNFTRIAVRNRSGDWPVEIVVGGRLLRVEPRETIRQRVTSSTTYRYRSLGGPAKLDVWTGLDFEVETSDEEPRAPRSPIASVEPITAPDSDYISTYLGTYDDGVPLFVKGLWVLVKERGGNRVRMSSDGGVTYGEWLDLEGTADGAGTRPFRGFVTDAGSAVVWVYPGGDTADCHIYRSADLASAGTPTASVVAVYDTDGTTPVDTVGPYYTGVTQSGAGTTVATRRIVYADYADNGADQPSRIYTSDDDGASFVTAWDGDPDLDDSHDNDLGALFRHIHTVDEVVLSTPILVATTGDSSGADNMHWLWSSDAGVTWKLLENEGTAGWSTSQAYRSIAWAADRAGNVLWASDSPGPYQGVFSGRLVYDAAATSAIAENAAKGAGTLTLLKADGTEAGPEGGDLVLPLSSTAYGLEWADNVVVCATLRNNQYPGAGMPAVFVSTAGGAAGTWRRCLEWETESTAAEVMSSAGDGWKQVWAPTSRGEWWLIAGDENRDYSRPSARVLGVRARIPG